METIAQIYSKHISHTTLNGQIGVDPGGSAAFIRTLLSGTISDKCIMDQEMSLLVIGHSFVRRLKESVAINFALRFLIRLEMWRSKELEGLRSIVWQGLTICRENVVAGDALRFMRRIEMWWWKKLATKGRVLVHNRSRWTLSQLYFHCRDHRLALACKNSFSKTPLLTKVDNTLDALNKYYKYSAVHHAGLQKVQAAFGEPQLTMKEATHHW